jgi:SAM-dependent methyltransferase
MFKGIRNLLKRNALFAFNGVYRDRWVASQAAQLTPGSRVLDVGAGSCPYRPLFYTQDFVGLKQDQLRHGIYGRIDYMCDASAIPVADASFDAILCTEVLEHVPQPVAVVSEIARILRPSGILILTAPLGSGIHQEPYHFYGGFTPYWYQHFLVQVGFNDIRIEANAGSIKFFGQEAIRFLMLSRPFLQVPFLLSIFWMPLWCFLFPLLGIIVPCVCHVLDGYDQEQRFTIGYHVTARRNKG